MKEAKADQIRAACDSHDQETLAELATTPGGFLDDELRRIVWPILVGCDKQEAANADSWHVLPPHRDERQVQLDVNRAFVYYPSNETEKQLTARRTALSSLIVSTLRQHPRLSYFQGYHDIVQVLLLVFTTSSSPTPSPDTSSLCQSAIARLSLLRIRDFMLPTLAATTAHLELLPSILRVADPELERHLRVAGTLHDPFFALSATLTLYSHDVQGYADIARLFDFLLSWEAVMSVYLFAIIIVVQKPTLLEIDFLEEPEMLHSMLSKLPNPLDLDSLITSTISLYRSHPPTSLSRTAWAHISRHSVLYTTRDRRALAAQTLRDGERLLDKQIVQVERLKKIGELRKTLRKIRKPAGRVGIAVLVVILAFGMRRWGIQIPVGLQKNAMTWWYSAWKNLGFMLQR